MSEQSRDQDNWDDKAIWGDQAFEQAVRDTAYFMWEQDGRPPGREKEYWYRAMEQHLRQRRDEEELRKGMQ